MNAQGSAQMGAKATIQVVWAVVGSICGTLITGALTTSPTLKLVGATLGAAIPPLISQAGRFQHLRAGAGIAVTIGALFLTYGGFTLFDAATGRPATFPPPPGVNINGSHDGSQDASQVGSGEECRNGICIKVTPASLSCTRDGCEPLTISNTGSKPLRVRTIEFDGEAAAAFHHGGECQNRQLSSNDECTLTVTFRPSTVGDQCAQGFV